jgi:beta-glucosidase
MIDVTFIITNVGKVRSKETIFLFVGHNNETVFLPKKELRAFQKVDLASGESKRITVSLDTTQFGYYNTLIKDWYAESGSYEISVGASGADIRLQHVVILVSPERPQPDLRKVAPAYYELGQGEFRVADQEFEALYGKSLPIHNSLPTKPYDHNSTLEDIEHTLVGKIILWVADRMTKKVTKTSEEEEAMMSNMIKEMPFHSLVFSGEGIISEAMMEGILHIVNGHIIKGIRALLKG